MATMKELSAQYRRQCAMIAMRIKELEQQEADSERLCALRQMLRETREVADTLECYYTGERNPSITLGRFYAAKYKRPED